MKNILKHFVELKNRVENAEKREGKRNLVYAKKT
jgi:hypothetical protein